MTDKITVADPGDQVRILNVLQMYENGALTKEGERPRVLPLMCKAVIDIRKYNRKLIRQLNQQRWMELSAEGNCPVVNKPILLRDEHEGDIHVESITLSIERLQDLLEHPDGLYWMYDIEEKL